MTKRTILPSLAALLAPSLPAIAPPARGEAVLRITAPAFDPYIIPIYLPSDFSGNFASLLKKSPPATQK